MPGTNARILGAASLNGGTDTLIESTDNGLSWHFIRTPRVTEWIEAVVPVPWSDDRVMLSDGAHFWKGTFPDPVWQQLPDPDSFRPTLIGMSKADSMRLYVTTQSMVLGLPIVGRLYTSSDRGATWTLLRDSVMSPVHKLLVDPADAGHCMTIADGIMESFDAGAYWDSIMPPPGSPYDVNIGDIHWSSGRVYAGEWYGPVYTTTDRGISWHRIPLDSGRFITDIVVDPNDACHAFILRTDALYETRDCGRSLHRSVLITSADDDGILRDVAHDVLALYPNVLSLSDPNPVLTVRLDRAPAEYCTISVYDLLGHRRHTVSLREHGN